MLERWVGLLFSHHSIIPRCHHSERCLQSTRKTQSKTLKMCNTLAPCRRSLVITAVFALALLFAIAARAGERAEDVWVVSMRCVPRCGPLQSAPEGIRYWRLQDDCRLEQAEAADFQADGTTPTVVFIHGNDTDADQAVTKGMYAYRSIRGAVGDRAFRYVIWSWPSERVCRRNRNDVPLKAAFCDVESYYLAAWLNTLPAGTKVGLAGHSFGPRIIAGAAHLLAGGTIAGRQLPAETVAAWKSGKRNPLRAVLLAAAVDAGSFAPCGRSSRRALHTGEGSDYRKRLRPEVALVSLAIRPRRTGSDGFRRPVLRRRAVKSRGHRRKLHGRQAPRLALLLFGARTSSIAGRSTRFSTNRDSRRRRKRHSFSPRVHAGTNRNTVESAE